MNYEGVIRLFIQIPLREIQSTYVVYRSFPLPTNFHELGRHIQIGHEDKWLAVSADRRTYYELEPGYYRDCKFGHVNFCEVTSPRMDLSHDSCLNGLFYGKDEEILRHYKRNIVGKNFNPVMRRMKTNQGLWVYSVNRPITFEEKCEGAREHREVVLRDAGWIKQPGGCDWAHEDMVLKAWRSLQSSYTMESNPVILPKIKTLFLNNERQALQGQPDVIREVLVLGHPEREHRTSTFPATQLFMQLRERQEAAMTQYYVILITAVIAATLVTTIVTFALVGRRGVLCKPSASHGTNAPAVEEGSQATPDDEETSRPLQPEPRFIPRQLHAPRI